MLGKQKKGTKKKRSNRNEKIALKMEIMSTFHQFYIKKVLF